MKKIYAAMLDVMEQIQTIEKSQTNKSQGFKFRGIDDVYNTLHGIMAKAGLFSTPYVLDRHTSERASQRGAPIFVTRLKIKYTFYAEDGSYVESVVEGEGMDFGDKSTSKAMAIAHKYALLQVFCIPTAEQKDPDAESFETTNKLEEIQADMRRREKETRAVIFQSLKQRMDRDFISNEMLLDHLGLKEKAELSKVSTKRLIELLTDQELGATPEEGEEK